jgi:hypothetical protein
LASDLLKRWCNFPPSTPLEVMAEYTHRPRRVGQLREEAKFEILPTSSTVVFYQLLP